MTEPSFELVERLFHAAVALPAATRGAFLDHACAGDAALRAAIEELLCHDAEPDDAKLTSPVAREAARFRADMSTVLGTAPRDPAPAEPMPDVPGYEMLGVLGKGGMGVVYQARQASLRRVVALKMLTAAGDGNRDLLSRFRSEAVILARLNHPNIVPIYDVGEFQGRPYFTMEYVDGPSLAKVIAGRPQDVMGSARIVEAVARAVHAVHALGVIHRDLKPGNILLATDRTDDAGQAAKRGDPACSVQSLEKSAVKVTDFGLAKELDADRGLTNTGTAMGTPGYMSPEQARGRAAEMGVTADVYSLGAVLYELLTGRPPFDAGSPAETIAQVLNDEPVSPAWLRPGLPRDIVTITLKCLEKSPKKRYATAQELADDLRRFEEGKPIRARAIGAFERTARWCRRRPLVAGLTGLCLLLGLGTLLLVASYERRLQDALQTAQMLADTRLDQLIQLNDKLGRDVERDDIYAAVLRYAEALKLNARRPKSKTSTEAEAEFRKRISAVLQAGPRLDHVVHHDRDVLAVGHGPDGVRLALVDRGSGGVEVCDAHSGRRHAGPAKLTGAAVQAALSADGFWLATLSEAGEAAVCDMRGGTWQTLPADRQPVARIKFHAEVPVLVTLTADATPALWDLSTGRPNGLPAPAGRATLGDRARRLVALTDDGTRLVWDIARGALEHALPVGPPAGATAVSSDGRRVAVAVPEQPVQVFDVAEGRWQPLGSKPRHALKALTFNASGNHLFARCADGSLHARPVPGDGTGNEIRAEATDPTHDEFTPDGGRLLLANAAGHVRFWDPATGRALTPLLAGGGPLAAVVTSSDGRRVTAVSQDGLVRVWDLEARGHGVATATVDHLVALAEVLAGRRVIDEHAVTRLEPDYQRLAWQTLTSSSGR